MAATTRRSRVTKAKGTGVTFGHFALPVAAVVALGLLFVGIKLFFLAPPKSHGVEISRIETPVALEKPSLLTEEPDFTLADEDTVSIVQPKAAGNSEVSIVLAGPLTQSGSSSRASSGTSESSQSAKKAQRQSVPAATANGTVKAQRPASGSSVSAKWGVQVGAFVNEGSASTLVSEIKKQGYAASVSKSAASGKTFHRVRVGAGNTREDADRLASELSGKGYPVSVVPML